MQPGRPVLQGGQGQQQQAPARGHHGGGAQPPRHPRSPTPPSRPRPSRPSRARPRGPRPGRRPPRRGPPPRRHPPARRAAGPAPPAAAGLAPRAAEPGRAGCEGRGCAEDNRAGRAIGRAPLGGRSGLACRTARRTVCRLATPARPKDAPDGADRSPAPPWQVPDSYLKPGRQVAPGARCAVPVPAPAQHGGAGGGYRTATGSLSPGGPRGGPAPASLRGVARGTEPPRPGRSRSAPAAPGPSR